MSKGNGIISVILSVLVVLLLWWGAKWAVFTAGFLAATTLLASLGGWADKRKKQAQQKVWKDLTQKW